jgi:hypothetical protein
VAKDSFEWMSLYQAAVYFGYKHPESLRQRLRKLREKGNLVDTGSPPARYKTGKTDLRKIVVFWINSRTPLIRSDAPRNLLMPLRGKRARDTDA